MVLLAFLMIASIGNSLAAAQAPMPTTAPSTAPTTAPSTASSTVGAAEELRVHVLWQSSPGCPDEADVSRRVGALMGREPFVEGPVGEDGSVDARMHVSFEREGEDYLAIVQMSRADDTLVGIRRVRMQTDDCAALAQSLALVIALLVDLPRSESEFLAPEPTPEVAQSWFFAVGVHATADLGRVGDVAYGAGLRLLLRGGLFGVELVGTVLRSEMDRAEGQLTGGGLLFRAGPCLGTPAGGSFGVVGCVGLEGGALSMEASGFSEVGQAAVSALVGPYLSLRGSWQPVSFFAVDLGVGGGASLIRDRFNVVNEDGSRETLYQPAPVYGFAELGVRFQFPI